MKYELILVVSSSFSIKYILSKYEFYGKVILKRVTQWGRMLMMTRYKRMTPLMVGYILDCLKG